MEVVGGGVSAQEGEVGWNGSGQGSGSMDDYTVKFLGWMNNASASTNKSPSPLPSPNSSILPFTHAFLPSVFTTSAFITT